MQYPLLVSNPANIFYLTGIGIESRDAWVLQTEKNLHFFTDARYNDVLAALKKPIMPHEISASLPLSTQIQQILLDEKSSSLFFEADDLTVLELKTLKKKIPVAFKPTTGLLAQRREIKNDQEIAKIKKACEAIDMCLHDIKKLIRPGISEYEIAYKLDSWLREKGYESAFAPIAAVDEHAAVPHFNTQKNGDKKISRDCVILIDAGAKVNGFCSDITRMFVIGKPSNTFMKCYTNMLAVQEETIQQLGKLKKYSDVDGFCRKELEKVGITPHAHATGHGIGIEVHEKPYVSLYSKDSIKPHHVVTIEPGTYIHNQFGIRIEDTVLIDEKGKPIALTQYPKML
jgi:Xaa-Pro aminopeptidase